MRTKQVIYLPNFMTRRRTRGNGVWQYELDSSGSG